MKEKDKAIARDLSKRDICKMSDGEFKVATMRILKELENRTENISEILTTEIK